MIGTQIGKFSAIEHGDGFGVMFENIIDGRLYPDIPFVAGDDQIFPVPANIDQNFADGIFDQIRGVIVPAVQFGKDLIQQCCQSAEVFSAEIKKSGFDLFKI